MLSPRLLSPSSFCRWGDLGRDPDRLARSHELTVCTLWSVRSQAHGFLAVACLSSAGDTARGANSGCGISREASSPHPCWGAVISQNEELLPQDRLCAATSPLPQLTCLVRSEQKRLEQPRLGPSPKALAPLPGGLPEGQAWLHPALTLAGAWPPLLGLWLADGDATSVAQWTPLSVAVCGNFAHCPRC